MKEQAEVYFKPKLDNPSLLVVWQEDVGRLGPKVIDLLNRHMKSRVFCEIEPVGFFPLSGVVIEKNIAKFPVSKFYAGERGDLVIFESNQPPHEQYRYLSKVLDFAQHYCRIKELYTISGTVSPIAHTSTRKLLAFFNQAEFQRKLKRYKLEDVTWNGPLTMNSYLLWISQKRDIPGLSLWLEVPFYLAMSQDLVAAKVALSFFDLRYNLNLDFTELDLEIADVNEKLFFLRREDSQIDRYIRTLEMGISLNEEEQLRLAHSVTEILQWTTV